MCVCVCVCCSHVLHYNLCVKVKELLSGLGSLLPPWVKFRPSALAASIFTCWAIPLVLFSNFLGGLSWKNFLHKYVQLLSWEDRESGSGWEFTRGGVCLCWEAGSRPHLEELDPAVLCLPFFYLLLEVENLPFHVPRDPFIVKKCWGSSRHESFSFIGKSVEVVPLLKSGIPAQPEKKWKSALLSGWTGFLRDLSECQLSIPWPSACLGSDTAEWQMMWIQCWIHQGWF